MFSLTPVLPMKPNSVGQKYQESRKSVNFAYFGYKNWSKNANVILQLTQK